MIITAYGTNAAAASGNAIFTNITLTYPTSHAVLKSLTMTLANTSAATPAAATLFLEYSTDAGGTWTEIKKFFLVSPNCLVIENMADTMIVPASTDTSSERIIRGRYTKTNATDTLDVSLDYNLVYN